MSLFARLSEDAWKEADHPRDEGGRFSGVAQRGLLRREAVGKLWYLDSKRNPWSIWHDALGTLTTALQTWRAEKPKLHPTDKNQNIPALESITDIIYRFREKWESLRRPLDLAGYAPDEIDKALDLPDFPIQYGRLITDADPPMSTLTFEAGTTAEQVEEALEKAREYVAAEGEKLFEAAWPKKIQGTHGTEVWSAHPPHTGRKIMDEAHRFLAEARQMLDRAGVGRLLNSRRVFLGHQLPAWHEQAENGDPNALASYSNTEDMGKLVVAGGFESTWINAGDISISTANMGLRSTRENYLTALIHELGHAFWYEEMEDRERDEYVRMREIAIKDGATKFVTPYAKKNAVEDFAETFTTMVMRKSAANYFNDPDSIQRFRILLRSGKMKGMTEDTVTSDETAALKAVGSGAKLQDVAAALHKPPVEVAEIMGKLQRAGLVVYYLTSGYALTPAGESALRGKAEMVEGGTFAHRSVGSRMPVAVQLPDAQALAQKKIEKMKDYADQRARTRDRLRQLANEGFSGQRRPLRTLRD